MESFLFHFISNLDQIKLIFIYIHKHKESKTDIFFFENFNNRYHRSAYKYLSYYNNNNKREREKFIISYYYKNYDYYKKKKRERIYIDFKILYVFYILLKGAKQRRYISLYLVINSLLFYSHSVFLFN